MIFAVVNLPWFANEYKEDAGVSGPQMLDHDLAVYLIAKHFPPLRKLQENLKHLFDPSVKDSEVNNFFHTMRQEYLLHYPTKPSTSDLKGWTNHVLEYLKKLFRPNAKFNNIGISQLLILKLIGN